jgi:DNA helicase-2/ATP-dependent DNA helicase PcrA
MNGFDLLAVKVVDLLRFSKNITSALAHRFPIIICDEHQDTSAAQNAVVMELNKAGARVRIFGDPMQSIYETDQTSSKRWSNLIAAADCFEELDTPHRWINVNDALGQWVLAARAQLKNGKSIDLRRPLPVGLTVVKAINISPKHGGYQVDGAARKQIDNAFDTEERMLILSAQNATIRSLRAFWRRGVLIWEGHTQEEVSTLIEDCKRHVGDRRRFYCCHGAPAYSRNSEWMCDKNTW